MAADVALNCEHIPNDHDHYRRSSAKKGECTLSWARAVKGRQSCRVSGAGEHSGDPHSKSTLAKQL